MPGQGGHRSGHMGSGLRGPRHRALLPRRNGAAASSLQRHNRGTAASLPGRGRLGGFFLLFLPTPSGQMSPCLVWTAAVPVCGSTCGTRRFSVALPLLEDAQYPAVPRVCAAPSGSFPGLVFALTAGRCQFIRLHNHRREQRNSSSYA